MKSFPRIKGYQNRVLFLVFSALLVLAIGCSNHQSVGDARSIVGVWTPGIVVLTSDGLLPGTLPQWRCVDAKHPAGSRTQTVAFGSKCAAMDIIERWQVSAKTQFALVSLTHIENNDLLDKSRLDYLARIAKLRSEHAQVRYLILIADKTVSKSLKSYLERIGLIDDTDMLVRDIVNAFDMFDE